MSIENQAKNLWDLWPEEAEWFVIGGLSKDCDAQSVKARFPHVRCIGFEPHPGSFVAQRSGVGIDQDAGPFPGTLLNKALWSSDGAVTLMIPPGDIDPGRSSLCRPTGIDLTDEAMRAAVAVTVDSVTLWTASQEHGPFRNFVLWLDVEHAEREALVGAGRLLEECLLVNVETFSHTHLSWINDLLTGFGLFLMRTWNGGRNPGQDALDYVYKRGSRR